MCQRHRADAGNEGGLYGAGRPRATRYQEPLWGFSLAMAADAALVLEDVAVAAAGVRDVLAPVAGRDLVGGCGVVWLGPGRPYLDRRAIVLGRR
ncbi:MAG: hypothetical protein ACRD0U_18695 [Acidimicrobiales bacterium]